MVGQKRKTSKPGVPNSLEDRPQMPLVHNQGACESKQGFASATRVRLTLGPGGRVVIPQAMREAMGVGEGDAILAYVSEGELHMVSPKVGAKKAQALVRNWIPQGVSLADDLIGERRREADERE